MRKRIIRPESFAAIRKTPPARPTSRGACGWA